MKCINPWKLAALLCTLPALLCAEEGNQRTIVFNEDRNQHYMTTKVYELKNVRAHDLMPFVRGAVKRFDSQSRVQSVDYSGGGKQFLVVSTGSTFLPWVDEMIATLDYPSPKVDESGARIEGDGISRWVYAPVHRGSETMYKALEQVFTSAGGEGASFYDGPSNLFYFKSSKSQGEAYLSLLKTLDRPVPQLEVKFDVYVVSDNDFRELGIDYLSWKNGPGAQLLSTGFNFADLHADFDSLGPEAIESILGFLPNSVNGIGGILVAPNIDATFLRMLAQKGKAWTASSGSLTLINSFDPAANDTGEGVFRLTFAPEFQNIVKDENQTIAIGALAESSFEFEFYAPSINFTADPSEGKLTLMSNWSLTVNSLAEVDNVGNASIESNRFSGSLTLDTGVEKLVGAFDKHVMVEQYIGMPFLGSIPVLKYLFGSESKVDSKLRVFVTMTAKPVETENLPTPAAGEMIDTLTAMNKENKAE